MGSEPNPLADALLTPASSTPQLDGALAKPAQGRGVAEPVVRLSAVSRLLQSAKDFRRLICMMPTGPTDWNEVAKASRLLAAEIENIEASLPRKAADDARKL